MQTCPCCGYCPTCGRKNAQPFTPWQPYGPSTTPMGPFWQIPLTTMPPNGTLWSGNIGIAPLYKQ